MIAISKNKDNKQVINRCNFNDIIDMVNDPSENFTKDTAPYIHSCDFIEDYAKGDISGIEEYSNIKGFDVIILDYDKGAITFESVVKLLKSMNLSFAAHTSLSHTEKHHKFHVIIKLTRNMSVQEWKYYTDAMKIYDVFAPNHLDLACFAAGRGFCIAVKTDNYKSFVNEGVSFDINLLEPFVRKAASKYKHSLIVNDLLKEQQKDKFNDAYRKKVIDSIIQEAFSANVNWFKEGVNSGAFGVPGNGTDTWFYTKICRLKDIGVTESEANTLLSRLPDMSGKKKTSWFIKVSTVYSGKLTKKSKQYTKPPTQTTTNSKFKQFLKPEPAKEIKPEPDNFYQPDRIKDFMAKHPRRKVITFREVDQ